jgi:hypothetical protein
MTGYRWVIENWTNETFHFEDEEEVNKRVSFAFYNCNDCKIEIVGKCQNVSIQKSKKPEITVDKVIS